MLPGKSTGPGFRFFGRRDGAADGLTEGDGLSHLVDVAGPAGEVLEPDAQVAAPLHGHAGHGRVEQRAPKHGYAPLQRCVAAHGELGGARDHR